MTPHYWKPKQVRKLLDVLLSLGSRDAYYASLIMWRAGLRISQVMALDWQDMDVSKRTVRLYEAKQGAYRTVPMHRDLVEAFGEGWAWRNPRSPVLGVSHRTVLRHIREGIESSGLDGKSHGTGVRRAGARSLRHSAALHWLASGVPLHVVSEWLGHANAVVTLRTYGPIIGSSYDIDDVP